MRDSFTRMYWACIRAFSEKQTCPRRMNRKENQDRWERGRWSSILVLQDKIKNLLSWRRVDGKWQQRRFGGTRWANFPWKPRVCSFCGCTHPEDAIRLLQSGWEKEGTTKFYKMYLQPPGYLAYLERLRKSCYLDNKNALTSPVPPVKVYGHHFTVEQLQRFNEAQQKEVEQQISKKHLTG